MRCRIVHTISGRVRLRVPALKYCRGLRSGLASYLQDQPGIVSLQVAPACASLVVTYDSLYWTGESLCRLMLGLSPERLSTYRSKKPARQIPSLPTTVSWFKLLMSSTTVVTSCVVEASMPLLWPLLIGSAWPIFSRAFKAIVSDDRLNVDVLDASATTLLAVGGQLPAAAFTVWLVNIADYIRASTMEQSRKTIGKLLDDQSPLVQEAPTRDTRMQNEAEQWADTLVPLSFAGAGAVALVTGNVGQAAAILMIDYGTGMRVSAPTTVLASLTRAARQGILIKDGRHLEDLAEVDAIVFDKTDTLTMGEPEITRVVPYSRQFPADQLLALAAAAEWRLPHPVARAIVRAAEARELEFLEQVTPDDTSAHGVEATVNGFTVCVGNQRFMEHKTVHLTQRALRDVGRMERRAMTPLFVAVDGRLRGLLGYADPLRPEASAVMQALRARGVKEIAMLTEDHSSVARQMAETLGISRYVAGVLPQGKAEVVRKLRTDGYKVAVVGDGSNESAALAQADVGIAMTGYAALAQETIHVAWRKGNLWKIPAAIDIAQDGVRVMHQNGQLLVIPNAVALALIFCGLLGPIGATLIGKGSTIAALANALRLLFTPPHGLPARSRQE